MATKKHSVSHEDRERVLMAFDSAINTGGLTSTQIGWKCNQSGTAWAESVLEVLHSERRVVKDTTRLRYGSETEHVTLWRLP